MRFRSPVAALRVSWQPGLALLLIPVVLMGIIATADILSPPDVHLGPLLVVAPAVAAAFGGPRTTSAIGALSVLTLVLIGLMRGVLATENLIVQIGSLVVLSALLIFFCVLRERHEDELARVRAVSEITQQVLLRPLPRRVGPLSIASRYRAAAVEADIGGDLYGMARTRWGTRLIIGDVQGKGLDSINDTALLLGAFRAAAHREADLPELMAYLDGSVGWGLAERSPQERVNEGFVTAAVLDIPDDEPLVRVINCGHPPPLLLRRGRTVALTKPEPSPPLGLGALLPSSYEVATHRFADGDLLLLYTDGVSEVRGADGAFYPLAFRAAGWSALGPEGLLTRISSDLRSYSAKPFDDDIAMIAVERTTSGAAAA
jgi:Stage II sporulation protein E (SpoIIE)